MRKINSFADVQIVLNDLLNKEDYRRNHARNTNGFQIKNTGAATDPDDVVILSQLTDYYDKRPSTSVVSKRAGVVDGTGFFGRIILPGVQQPANDVLANRYHVRIPRDSDGVLMASQIDLQSFTITAKIKPVTGFTMQLQISTDGGIFFNILASGLTLPGGQETVTLTPVFSPTYLKDNDQIQVDVAITDTTVSGIEGILQGVYSL